MSSMPDFKIKMHYVLEKFKTIIIIIIMHLNNLLALAPINDTNTFQ